MKIYNLGNDYAYQRKQKHVEKESDNKIGTKLADSTVISKINVGNKVQKGGEGEVMATPVETLSPKQKPKKKKETGTENEQPEG